MAGAQVRLGPGTIAGATTRPLQTSLRAAQAVMACRDRARALTNAVAVVATEAHAKVVTASSSRAWFLILLVAVFL